MPWEIVHLCNLLRDLRGSEISFAQNPVTAKKETDLMCKVKNFLLV